MLYFQHALMTFYGLQIGNPVKKLQLIVALLLGCRVGGGGGRVGRVLLSGLDELDEVIELALG